MIILLETYKSQLLIVIVLIWEQSDLLHFHKHKSRGHKFIWRVYFTSSSFWGFIYHTHALHLNNLGLISITVQCYWWLRIISIEIAVHFCCIMNCTLTQSFAQSILWILTNSYDVYPTVCHKRQLAMRVKNNLMYRMRKTEEFGVI